MTSGWSTLYTLRPSNFKLVILCPQLHEEHKQRSNFKGQRSVSLGQQSTFHCLLLYYVLAYNSQQRKVAKVQIMCIGADLGKILGSRLYPLRSRPEEPRAGVACISSQPSQNHTSQKHHVHVTKVNFVELGLLLKIQYVEFEDKPKLWSNTCGKDFAI